MAFLPFEEEGAALKAEGMARAVRHIGTDYPDRFEKAVQELAKLGQPFTADAVTELVGFPRAGHGTNRNNAVGALMSACARKGWIRPHGFRSAERSRSHARTLRQWIGVAKR